jgi:hypothetical protein
LDLIWLALLAAVLMTWYKDHVRMLREYEALAVGMRNRGTSWSINQVLGKPNTPRPGDQVTAWAAATQEKPEWIIVEFPSATEISRIAVFETYNPGAIERICTLSFRNQETELWKGTDPTPTTAAMGTSVFNIKPGTVARRLKIYLRSESVPGWNEIDAVRLDGVDGSSQWVSAAWASSSYGENNEAPTWFWP